MQQILLDSGNIYNTELTGLSCHHNQLQVLDVSRNTMLTSLDCQYNILTELDVSNTNLGESKSTYPLNCNMSTLSILYLKTGWLINGINENKNLTYIRDSTDIQFKN